MQLQLSSYIQQSLKRHQEIDRKLQPLLKVIKDSKIHSIHMISNEYEMEQNGRVMKSGKEFAGREGSFKKYYSENGRVSPQKNRSSVSNKSPRAKSKYNSISVNDDRTQQKLFYRNPNSKIKKHLIQTMRFQSLQLIDDKHRSTRFQGFIDTLVHKHTSQSQRKRNVTSHRLQRVRLIDNQEAVDIFESCPRNIEESVFKVKLRKRFWKRESTGSGRRISNLRNVLCVKGMKQMAITIDP